MIKISHYKNMANIDSHEIAYGNIRYMYLTGNGCWLQLEENLEPHREEILKLCGSISDSLYRLQDLIEETSNDN